MRKSVLISLFERRLAQLGCPASQSRRSARELAEHYEDLKAGALEDGLSEEQAEARAGERLGDPRALAERLTASVRQSSWWGRHPVIGFCVLPPAGILALLPAVTFLTLEAVKGCLPAGRWQALAGGGAGYGVLTLFLRLSFYGSLLTLMTFVCGIARRAAVGLKWTLAACFLCSLHAAFFDVWIHPHRLSVGYLTHPNWVSAAIPLLCAAGAVAWQKRAAARLAVTLTWAVFFLAPSAKADEKPGQQQRGWIGGEYKVVRPWSMRENFYPPPEVLYDRSFPTSVRRWQNAAIKITALGTNTPAALAGLARGDLILEVDHRPVTRLGDFRRQIDGSKPGAYVTLTVCRNGKIMKREALVGTETFRRHSGNFAVSLLPIARGWRLIPDGGLSFVFAGWETRNGLRYDLGSQREVFDPSWKLWVGNLEFSMGKRVISETNASSSAAMPKTALPSAIE